MVKNLPAIQETCVDPWIWKVPRRRELLPTPVLLLGYPHVLLGSTAINKASGCNGIPVELFKILKDNAIKVMHSICQQIWKTQKWPQDWKKSIFIPVPKKSSTKECANHWTIALISHASKVMLKILHARLQHYVNQELPDVQAGFRKERETRVPLVQIANIRWIIEKAREFQEKKSTSVSSTMLKPLTVWS